MNLLTTGGLYDLIALQDGPEQELGVREWGYLKCLFVPEISLDIVILVT